MLNRDARLAALWVSAYRRRRLQLAELLAAAARQGLEQEAVVELLHGCAGCERGRTQLARERQLLVRGYAHGLELDELAALALLLGWQEEAFDELCERCGAVELRRAA